MNIQGAYKFYTEAIKSNLEFAFLYTKLQETDRDFVFTGGTTSWRRHIFNFTPETIACIEIPEPIGVYATEVDALRNNKKPGVTNPGGGTDPTIDIPVEDIVTLFYEISETPSNSFLNIFEVAGISTHPSGNPQVNLDPIYYGFWRESGVLVGIAPWEKPELCPLFKTLTIPEGLFRVGYSGDIPSWKVANYIPSTLNNGLNYQTSGGVENENTPYNGEEISFWKADRSSSVSYFSRKSVIAYENLITPGLSCSETLNNDAWLGGELPHRYQMGGQINSNILICVVCDVARKGAIDSFLNQVMTYWNIPGTLRLLRGANAFGCGDVELGFPPNPNPEASRGVFAARFKGRYSNIILNYQAKGKVKELELPIEFPTRATKIKLIKALPGNYHPNIPIDSQGYQAVEQPLISEAFLGRVAIDKENIYIAILYGTQREWEQGKELPDDRFAEGLPLSWVSDRDGNPQIGDGFLNFGDDRLARPVKDSWKYCKIFVIDKKTFSIKSTTTKTNPQSLTDIPQLVLDWTILEQQNTPRFVDYYTVGDKGEGIVSSLQITDASSSGFSGSPICYPQISGTIRGDWTVSVSGDRFFPINSVPDFIKPQTLWTHKDWLFWNLLERPKKPLSNTSYFRFELEGQFSGHGRSSIKPNRFYIDQVGVPIKGTSTINHRTSENYFGEVVESERLRGSGILGENQNIIKWVRISPYSYPYFEPGISAADNNTYGV